MRIQNNIMALNTHRQYTINTNSVAKSTEKLSSGYRVNRAGDDAAGLAISEKMRAQIKGLTMASKNSSDAISLIQTAEGALQESHNILQRMRELAVQSSSDTNETSIDRAALNAEFKQLIAELDDTARTARFNDMGVIDGSYAAISKTLGSGTTTPAAVTANIAAAMVGTHTVTATYVLEKASTATAATAPTVTLSNQGSSTVTFTGITASGASLNGAVSNGIQYSVEADTTKATLTLQVDGKTYTASADMAGAAGAVIEFNFDGLGTLKYTLNAAVSTNQNANTEAGNLDGIKLTFNGGVDSIVTPAKDAHIKVECGGETKEVYAGDSNVQFSNGLVLTFEKLGTITGTGPFNATSNVEVGAETGKPMVIQSGSNQYDELRINIDRMDAATLGVKFSDISSQSNASKAITEVNNALNKVSTQRAALGALENRLNYKINNLNTSAENLTAAESRIRDLDMAKEMSEYTKNNILMQASTAMLAQANSAPQNVLQLLQ